MAIKICIVSTKGGVGKSTLTANLGGFLADLGQRVLLIDADSQPTLSSYYHITHLAPYGLTDFIVQARSEDVVSHTNIEGLHLIYSDDPDGKLRDWVRDAVDGRVRLKFILARPEFEAYDFILLDTQGAIGAVQDAIVPAADLLLSPIPPEILSAREFVRGTVGMLQRLEPMKYMGAPIAPLRGLIYRQDRTVDARQIADELRSEAFLPSRGAITILHTAVPASVTYREAASLNLPVHRHDRKSRGSTPCAAVVMATLVAELFPHLAEAARALARGEAIREIAA